MELLNIFVDIADWFKGGVVVGIFGIVVTMLRKRDINIKRILGFSAKVTKEIGEAFLGTSVAFNEANLAIRKDNKLKERSVKDVIEAGKEAWLEWKDVIMIIKPKPKK
jgi:hypothetical protein